MARWHVEPGADVGWTALGTSLRRRSWGRTRFDDIGRKAGVGHAANAPRQMPPSCVNLSWWWATQEISDRRTQG
jgi:hypothetical protein